jgi:tetratricopeptide (TPR) repeat protein
MEDSSETLIREAKLSLQAGDVPAARVPLHTILERHPDHREGLYYLAVCERQTGESTAAIKVLDRLLSKHPQYGRAHQEYGHNLAANKDAEGATVAFEKAVKLNPALMASWQALLGRYRFLGSADKAEDASNHIRWLESMPGELRTVSSLLHESKLYVAEQICRAFLKKEPHHREAMRLLAEIGSKLQILDDAEFLLESCVEFYPDYHRARLDYVQVLHKRQKFNKALNQARELHHSDPQNLLYEVTLAAEQQAVGNFDEALYIYEQVLAKNGDLPRVLVAQGHAQKTSGLASNAVASYQRAYRCQPSYGDAYWSLANLKTYRFSEEEIQQMTAQESSPEVDSTDRIHLCFALGKALEDRQQFDEAFAFYERGNALKQTECGYDADKLEEELLTQKALFGQQFFSERADMGCESSAPIFIVGLPRAGSTLLEQILASHSEVDGTMELANIIGTANRLGGRNHHRGESRYPSILVGIRTPPRFPTG